MEGKNGGGLGTRIGPNPCCLEYNIGSHGRELGNEVLCVSQQKHLGYFNHILGCLSCISVTKECYVHC